MKTSLINLIVLTMMIFSRNTQPKSSNEENHNPKDLEHIITKYDSILSINQHYYRMWISSEDTKSIGVFDANSLMDIKTINKNISYFLTAKDSILSFMVNTLNISTEYGNSLATFLKDNNDKEVFRGKWRTYQEGVTMVMNYDIETVTNFLNALQFLKSNFNNFKVDQGTIFFYTDELISQYNSLIGRISDTSDEIEQLEKRSKTMHDFIEAIDFVKTSVGLNDIDIINHGNRTKNKEGKTQLTEKLSKTKNYSSTGVTFSYLDDWEVTNDADFNNNMEHNITLSRSDPNSNASVHINMTFAGKNLNDVLNQLRSQLKSQSVFKSIEFSQNTTTKFSGQDALKVDYKYLLGGY